MMARGSDGRESQQLRKLQLKCHSSVGCERHARHLHHLSVEVLAHFSSAARHRRLSQIASLPLTLSQTLTRLAGSGADHDEPVT